MSSHIIGALNMDGYNVTSDLAYLNSITKLSEEYDEFALGYWKNLSLFNSSGRKDYLFEYSKYHFKHNISVTACSDWLIQGATVAKNHAVLEKSKALKKYLTEHREMGERFTIESWEN